jgi:hypothetical protein
MPLELHFSDSSPLNTVLSNTDGQAIYKIETPRKMGSRTSQVFKIIPNEDAMDMRDHFEKIAEVFLVARVVA